MATVAREQAAPTRLSIERTQADDGAAWVARVDGVPSCAAEGETPAAAAAAADAAVAAAGAEHAALTYSGRLLLRMPKTLHAELAARADAAQVSLNQLLVGTLADAVAGAPRAEGARRRLPRSVRLALAADALVAAVAAAVAVLVFTGAWHPGA